MNLIYSFIVIAEAKVRYVSKGIIFVKKPFLVELNDVNLL
jgi:hypothetical protein